MDDSKSCVIESDTLTHRSLSEPQTGPRNRDWKSQGSGKSRTMALDPSHTSKQCRDGVWESLSFQDFEIITSHWFEKLRRRPHAETTHPSWNAENGTFHIALWLLTDGSERFCGCRIKRESTAISNLRSSANLSLTDDDDAALIDQ
jgi:hypothetical protein